MVKHRGPRGWVITLFCVLNFLLYLVVIGMWISIPEETKLNLFTTITSLAMTSGLLLINKEAFSSFYQSHFFKKLMSSLVSICLIFIILGFLNFLSFKNPIVWDVTKGKINSLTDQTKSVLSDIQGDVSFRIFSLKKHYQLVYALADLYRLEKKNIEISFVDAELEPQLVRKVGITKVPAIEVSYKGKTKVVSNLNELELTNALVKVSRSTEPTLYFIKGHGELDLFSYENEGASHLSSLLKAQTMEVRFLNLREKAQVPRDAKAVILLGSKEGFFPNEIKALKDYQKAGGDLIFALDPDFNGQGPTDLYDLLSDLGVQMRNDLVIDQIKHVNGSQGSVPVIHHLDPKHPITKDFKGDVFFPLVQSMELQDKGWQEIARSNRFPAAWGETSRKELTSMKLSFTQGEDHQGPLTYAATKEEGDSKVVVIGNSSFITNTYKKFPKNFQFFLNAISWVVEEERLITLNSPVLEDKPVFMSQNQIGVIFYFSIIFCPLVLLIMAFLFYRRRNHG
jgi:ABC-type uncharacterized transport system involved in gliding motility auxiliary subunit